MYQIDWHNNQTLRSDVVKAKKYSIFFYVIIFPRNFSEKFCETSVKVVQLLFKELNARSFALKCSVVLGLRKLKSVV